MSNAKNWWDQATYEGQPQKDSEKMDQQEPSLNGSIGLHYQNDTKDIQWMINTFIFIKDLLHPEVKPVIEKLEKMHSAEAYEQVHFMSKLISEFQKYQLQYEQELIDGNMMKNSLTHREVLKLVHQQKEIIRKETENRRKEEEWKKEKARREAEKKKEEEAFLQEQKEAEEKRQEALATVHLDEFVEVNEPKEKEATKEPVQIIEGIDIQEFLDTYEGNQALLIDSIIAKLRTHEPLIRAIFEREDQSNTWALQLFKKIDRTSLQHAPKELMLFLIEKIKTKEAFDQLFEDNHHAQMLKNYFVMPESATKGFEQRLSFTREELGDTLSKIYLSTPHTKAAHELYFKLAANTNTFGLVRLEGTSVWQGKVEEHVMNRVVSNRKKVPIIQPQGYLYHEGKSYSIKSLQSDSFKGQLEYLITQEVMGVTDSFQPFSIQIDDQYDLLWGGFLHGEYLMYSLAVLCGNRSIREMLKRIGIYVNLLDNSTRFDDPLLLSVMDDQGVIQTGNNAIKEIVNNPVLISFLCHLDGMEYFIQGKGFVSMNRTIIDNFKGCILKRVGIIPASIYDHAQSAFKQNWNEESFLLAAYLVYHFPTVLFNSRYLLQTKGTLESILPGFIHTALTEPKSAHKVALNPQKIYLWKHSKKLLQVLSTFKEGLGKQLLQEHWEYLQIDDTQWETENGELLQNCLLIKDTEKEGYYWMKGL